MEHCLFFCCNPFSVQIGPGMHLCGHVTGARDTPLARLYVAQRSLFPFPSIVYTLASPPPPPRSGRFATALGAAARIHRLPHRHRIHRRQLLLVFAVTHSRRRSTRRHSYPGLPAPPLPRRSLPEGAVFDEPTSCTRRGRCPSPAATQPRPPPSPPTRCSAFCPKGTMVDSSDEFF